MRLYRLSAQAFEHDLKQLGRLARFGDELIHPRGQTAVAVLGKRIGRHRHNGHIRSARQLPYPTRGLQAAHDGHLHVHQHQGVVGLRRFGDGHRTVVSQVVSEPNRFKQQLDHVLVDGVIFHDQYTPPLEGRLEPALQTGITRNGLAR